MSLGALAARLYSIQSKRDVPLSTAISFMVRESLAVRFSVYSMVKSLTKSELLASIAEAKYGFKTPQEKQQDKKDKLKQEEDLKFKQYTVSSILNINQKLNTLATVTQRNTDLINSLYYDLGYYKGQRRINPNTTMMRSVRVPLREKTVKGQIDRINKELAALRSMSGVEDGYKFIRKEKPKKEKEKEKVDKGFLENIVAQVLATAGITALLKKLTPLLRFIPRLGLGSALSLGALALTIPAAVRNTKTRAGGEQVYDDPFQENISRAINTASLMGGAFMAGKAAYSIGSAVREKWKSSKMGKESERNARIKRINKYTEQFKSEGYSHKEAQKMAGEKVKQVGNLGKKLQKMKFINRAISGIAKRFPAVVAADVAYRLSQMVGLEADYGSRKIPYSEYKTGMVNNYSEIISSVGLTAFGTIAGSLAGTGLFPGIGTGLGAVAGMGVGGLMSLFVNEESPTMLWIAGKIFEMLHEDKTAEKPQVSSILTERNQRRSGGTTVSADQASRQSQEEGDRGREIRQGRRGGGGRGVRSVLPENIPPGQPLVKTSGRPLLDFIGSIEAYPSGNYHSVYGGGSIDLSEMTIAQVFDMQRSIINNGPRGRTSSAVGKYQFIYGTLKEEVEKAGLNIETTKFTPEIQDKLIMNRLVRIRGYREYGADKISAADFAHNLSKEFASLPDPKNNGQSHFQGDAIGNKALVSLEKVYTILGVRPGENPTVARNRPRSEGGTDIMLASAAPEPYSAQMVASTTPPLPTSGNAPVVAAPPVDVVAEEQVSDDVISAQAGSQAALVALTSMQQQLNSISTELIKIQRDYNRNNDEIIISNPSLA